MEEGWNRREKITIKKPSLSKINGKLHFLCSDQFRWNEHVIKTKVPDTSSGYSFGLEDVYR